MGTNNCVCFFLLLLAKKLYGVENIVASNCLYPDHNTLHKGMTLVQKLNGERYSAKDDNRTYKYTVGICTYPTINSTRERFRFAAVIQTSLLRPFGSAIVIGRYNDTDIKLGTNWAMLEFGSGDNYTNQCSSARRQAVILITCNPDIDQPLLRIIEENSRKNNKCYYLFELEHPKLCNARQTLGVFAILAIISVSLTAIYFCVGIAIKKICFNAEGIEVIPNIAIWRCLWQLASNCASRICRPKPSRMTYDPCQTAETGNLIGPDHLDDDDHMVTA